MQKLHYSLVVAVYLAIVTGTNAFQANIHGNVWQTTTRIGRDKRQAPAIVSNFNAVPGTWTRSSGSGSRLYMSDPIPPLDLEELDNKFIGMKPQVYPERWMQLGYLSMLALLSDWICFSVAAAPSVYEATYPGHSAAALIDIFLFTNVASSFLVTDSVRSFGLEKCIKFAAVLMAAGCFLRSGLDPLLHLLSSIGNAVPVDMDLPAGLADAAATATSTVPAFPFMLAGTVLVGAAQPFFQCTPPLLSAMWFGSDERATSTAIALNFNQIGIATAFLVGGTMATTGEGLANYFALIAVITAVVTTGTLLQFQNKPPTPPSTYVCL
jgi:hypothetical protein